MLLRYRSLYDN